MSAVDSGKLIDDVDSSDFFTFLGYNIKMEYAETGGQEPRLGTQTVNNEKFY